MTNNVTEVPHATVQMMSGFKDGRQGHTNWQDIKYINHWYVHGHDTATVNVMCKWIGQHILGAHNSANSTKISV